MPQIRFPKTGEKLVRYIAAPNTPPEDAIFETGAHLVTFAASLAFYKKEKDNTFEPVKERPQPIDLTVFRNHGLYEVLQVICMADKGSHEIIDKEKEVCELIELYASAGFRFMQAMYNECDGAFYFRQLVEQLEAVKAMEKPASEKH